MQERDSNFDIAEKKLNNYKEFLHFVQLNYESHQTIDMKRPQKTTPKLAVWIGRGNNRNLLVTLFKKRWWWRLADSLEEADLVWTQLKLPELFEKQEEGGNLLRQQLEPKLQKRKME